MNYQGIGAEEQIRQIDLCIKLKIINSILFSAVHITIHQKPSTRSNLTTETALRYVDVRLASEKDLSKK